MRSPADLGQSRKVKSKYQEAWSFSCGFQPESSQCSPNTDEVWPASSYAKIGHQQPEPCWGMIPKGRGSKVVIAVFQSRNILKFSGSCWSFLYRGLLHNSVSGRCRKTVRKVDIIILVGSLGEGCQIQRWQVLRISNSDDSSSAGCRSAGASQVFLLFIVTVWK